jgi:tetratricopeptide (TPR) repeat protein
LTPHRYQEALRAAGSALEAAQGLDDVALTARVTAVEGHALKMPGDFGGALARFTWLLNLVEGERSGPGLEGLEGVLLASYSDWVECASYLPDIKVDDLFAVLDRGEAYARRSGQPGGRARLLYQRSALLERVGRFDQGVPVAEEALAIRERYPAAQGVTLANHRWRLGRLLRHAGRHDEALRAYKAALDTPGVSDHDRGTLTNLPWSSELIRGTTPSDFCLYLDERGTPGADSVFVAGGVLVFDDEEGVAERYTAFLKSEGLDRKKGTRFNEDQRLAVVGHLAGEPVLPVGVHSTLSRELRDATRRASRLYGRINADWKTADRIAPASWVWKVQMNAAMSIATVAAITYVGAIRSLSIHTDRFSDTVQGRQHYEALMASKLTLAGRNTAVTPPSPSRVEGYANAAMGLGSWDLNLNAKGSIAAMADHVCALYGRHLAGETEAWRDWSMGLKRPAMPPPACVGVDVTGEVAGFLTENAKWVEERARQAGVI